MRRVNQSLLARIKVWFFVTLVSGKTQQLCESESRLSASRRDLGR